MLLFPKSQALRHLHVTAVMSSPGINYVAYNFPAALVTTKKDYAGSVTLMMWRMKYESH